MATPSLRGHGFWEETGKTHRSRDILSALMDPHQAHMVPWSSRDLRAILEHQLSVSPASEPDLFGKLAHRSRENASEIVENFARTPFGDLLLDDSPSPLALRMVKEYAKQSLASEEDLPRDVARVLYLCAIVRARKVGFHDITALDDASLQREARRCLTFGWLPDRIRELIRSFLERR